VGLIQSINFASYDSIRRYLHQREHPNAAETDYLTRDSLVNVGIAGCITGGLLSIVTGPLIHIKTFQQVTGQNFRTALHQSLLAKNGQFSIKGGYVGIVPHFLSETIGRAAYYGMYEYCKRSIVQYKQEGSTEATTSSVTMGERMMCAAIAGVTCWAIIFPADTLRNRLYNQKSSAAGTQMLSTTEMMQSMYRHEGGLRPFYRGFSLTVLRAGPVAAAVLPIYDSVLEWLSSEDTQES
jgi:hypothetical protein